MRLYGTLYAAVYVLMILVVFILPFYSTEGYSIVNNSLSELGAQATPGSWIMNAVLVLLSIVVVLLGTKVLRRFWLPLYMLYFFAFALLFTAIFRHAPIYETFYSEREHLTHSIFSFITGTTFSLYCFIIFFYLKTAFEKATAIFMLSLAIGLSFLMMIFSEYWGVFQRILFITAFGWLFYSFVSFKFSSTRKK